jgi:hypothetical protein
MKTRSDALDTILEKLSRGIETAKTEEEVAKIRFEKARRNVEQLQRDLYVALARSMGSTPEVFIDPISGEMTEEWANRILMQAIESDEEYMDAVTEFEQAQEDLFHKSTHAEATLHKLSAHRSRANLMSALMNLEASG